MLQDSRIYSRCIVEAYMLIMISCLSPFNHHTLHTKSRVHNVHAPPQGYPFSTSLQHTGSGGFQRGDLLTQLRRLCLIVLVYLLA